jgi:carbon storage regulator
MVALNHRVGDRLRIGDQIVLTVLAVRGQRVHLKIDVPEGMTICREETYQQKKGTTQESRPRLEIYTWLDQTVLGQAGTPA